MNNKKMKKENIFSVFFNEFIRIKNVIAWTAIAFIGFILGITNLNLSDNLIPFSVFFISFFFIAALTFAMNNYFDADSDKKNPRRRDINAIASGRISKQNGIILNLIFILISLIVTVLHNFEIFLFCIYLIFLGLAYSVPPIRLKGRPRWDVIWHFFGFFSIVMYGSYVAGNISIFNWLIAISLGVWSSVGQVGNHIADYTFDKESGTKTYAVWIGLDKSKTTINILTLIHLILLIPLILFYSLNYTITIIIVIIFPIIGFLILRPKKGNFPTKRCYTYFFTIVIGGAVYLSCIVYNILFILDTPTLDLIPFIAIP
jgi:4-hydroxybenzoate polyprenyltransferase